MIIFRVTTGRSFTKFPTDKNGNLSQPIEFAHRNAESSFLRSSCIGGVARDPDFDLERLGGESNGEIHTPTTQTSQDIIQINEEKRDEAALEKR
ncbi:hypothetical protein EST38_g13905 [Candolleomyces aberdarensis]|uniref:Uncharacterized protein n=1 Tax=Candolleomyces aberdarensis TaxID=2316362 RepID=A0A4Q2CYN3_9AGAR|nr:hypothetical protein EST38_g13905 [Candolleomyces aberdarensis]